MSAPEKKQGIWLPRAFPTFWFNKTFRITESIVVGISGGAGFTAITP
jgi:hypothetical protein